MTRGLYLDPVCGSLVNGIKNGARVCGGNNPSGHLRIINRPCTRFQFTKKEFIEGLVSIEFRDKKLVRRNLISLNKVGLHAVSCVTPYAGKMEPYNFSHGLGIVKVFALFLGFFQEQMFKISIFQDCGKSANKSESTDLHLEDVQRTTYASQFACTTPQSLSLDSRRG